MRARILVLLALFIPFPGPMADRASSAPFHYNNYFTRKHPPPLDLGKAAGKARKEDDAEGSARFRRKMSFRPNVVRLIGTV
uniref:Putative secreted peptide n=1 Tax=Anopheles braziliensis TaxID=58242 RepID=A0A2M3ZX98_9DIPT